MKKTMIAIATIFVSLGLVVVGGSAQAMSRTHGAELNGMIAFDQPVSRTGHVQIFTMNPDGSHVRELTFSRNADNVHPIWSPDGSKLVFSRFFADKGEVWVMNADGTGPHAITHGGFSGLPAYSPNGKLIAFERGISLTNDGLWVMNADGTHMRRVTRNPRRSSDTACECDTKPHWSPDGEQIVFARIRTQTRSAVLIVNLDGTNLRRLTPWAMNATTPVWSPNGARIAFAIQCCGFPGFVSHIFTIRPDGGGLVQLTRDRRGESFDPTWSPDGRMIAFAHYPGVQGFGDIYEMKADGTHIVNITRSPSRNGSNNSEEGPWWGTHPSIP
jgi:TolB protein